MHGCPRCGLPFDSVHAAAQHAWKQQDEAHEDVESLDDGIRAVLEDGNPDGKLPDGDGVDEPSPDGKSTVTEDGGEPHGDRTVADGGNPAFDAPDPVDVATDGGDRTSDPTCPGCGGNRWFDPAEAFPADSEAAQYDHGCPNCTDLEAGEVQVWNE
jgi:hypothetical protein